VVAELARLGEQRVEALALLELGEEPLVELAQLGRVALAG
jgi:hypothetical protein